jgi:2-polyprenyl-6-methoxyphenol hydroxylase-like FAD-dependent oxidoreductase
MNKKTKVIIVGAGPCGLSLASQLHRYQIDFEIFDKHNSTTELSKATVIHARSLEIFDEIGIAKEIIKQGKIVERFNILQNGKVNVELPLGKFGEGLSPFPFVLMLDQSKTEKILHNHLTEKKVNINWNFEIVDFEENDQEVIAKFRNLNGEKIIVNADYIVGCDGANSFVRQKLGFTFEGTTMEKIFYVADAKIKSDTVCKEEIYESANKKAYNAMFPMGGQNHYRIIGVLPKHLEHKEELQFDDLKDLIREEMKINVDFQETYWFSKYKVHSRITSNFGQKRCYLAGDSAHIHTPAGGKGMNTGIQDAYNLAWKLALVIKQSANDKLLETYNIERLENAHNLIKSTDRQFNFVTTDNFFERFVKNNIITLLLKFVTETKIGTKYMFKEISMIDIEYYKSPLTIKSNIGKIKSGQRIPDFQIDAISIFKKINQPKYKLLQFGTDKKFTTEFDFDVVKISIKEIPKIFGKSSNFFILLRPDNHICYIGKSFESVTNSLKMYNR